MLFHENSKKFIRVITAIVAILVSVSMVLLYFPVWQ